MSERFMGEDGRGEGYFSIDQWIAFQRRLITAEVLMRVIAPTVGASVTTNIRGDWPARGIRLRRGSKIGEVRIELNPDYLQDKVEFYEMRLVVLVEPLPVFFGKLEGTEVLAKCQPEEMQDRVALGDRIAAGVQQLSQALGM